jgi:hypothetical protein
MRAGTGIGTGEMESKRGERTPSSLETGNADEKKWLMIVS